MIHYGYRTLTNRKRGHLTVTDSQPLFPEPAEPKHNTSFKHLFGKHPGLWFVLVVVAWGFVMSTFWLRSTGALVYASTSPGTVWLLLVILALLTTLSLVIRWLRWHFLTRCLDLRLPTKNSLKLYGVTLPAFVTPLFIGELLRAPLVAKRHPHAPATIYLVWLIERLADVAVLGLLLLVAQERWTTISTIVGLAVLLLYILRAIFKTRTAHNLTQPERLSVIALTSLCAWLLPILGLWLILRQLETSIPAAIAAETFSTSMLWGGLTTIPPDIGLTGSSMISRLQASGISPAVASLAVSLFWAGTSWYALSLGLLALLQWRDHIVTMLRPPRTTNHFDAIAPVYKQQIPAYIRERVLTRKIAVMRHVLQASGTPPGARGLDLGCGPGWHACEMARLGYRVNACDLAYQQIKQTRGYAAREDVRLASQVADARLLPYADNAYDFVYSINLIHHITSEQARREIFGEIVRVLKPGGIFFLQEINTENPLFAFYMGYIFPLLRDIDEGTEWWVKPSALPEIEGARWAEDKAHFTFIPDFTPQRLLRALTGLERVLETSMQRWSAHYVARLVKEENL